MTQGERDSSGGELTSFLHLTGLRPIVLLLIAGLAGAAGVYLALGAPPTYQARYVLNVDRVADNDLAVGELALVAEEIVSTASFPEVQLTVEEETGLVEEDDYEIVVNRAGGALININVVADDPADAQQVAIETGIAAVSLTTERQSAGIESSRNQLEEELQDLRNQMALLTSQAGGVNPVVALANAEAALLQRRADELNPPTINQIQADGTIVEIVVPYDGPTAAELQVSVDELSPIEREFVSLQTSESAITVTLADRNNSIRELDSAISLIESERETSLVINEVVTEETSRITGLLTGLLLFAVPAALLVIIFFTLLDFIRPKPEETKIDEDEEDFESAGVIVSSPQRALPASSVRRSLTIVEEDQDGDILASTEIIEVVSSEPVETETDIEEEVAEADDTIEVDDDLTINMNDLDLDSSADEIDSSNEPAAKPSKSKTAAKKNHSKNKGKKRARDKDGRWGRSENSKAG